MSKDNKRRVSSYPVSLDFFTPHDCSEHLRVSPPAPSDPAARLREEFREFTYAAYRQQLNYFDLADMLADKAVAAIQRDYVSRAEVATTVGKDEAIPFDGHPFYNGSLLIRGRNELRQEIRSRLGLERKEETQ